MLPSPHRPRVPEAGHHRTSPTSEALWIVVIGLLGLLPRLLFVFRFPTRPLSDFRFLLDFAIALGGPHHAHGMYQWDFFSPGMPTLLALVLQVVPGPFEAVARAATAVLTGLMPLLPLLLLRGAGGLLPRVVIALLLCLWPGQIAFCGLPAQDNWVLPPSVALAVLAVRALRLERGYPLAAGLLLGVTASIRQEMLVVLLPAAVAAAGLFRRSRPRSRALAVLGGAVAAVLLLISCERAAATGHFSPFSSHGGLAVLGAYAPGAAGGWIPPRPFMETLDPALARLDPALKADRERLVKAAWGIALREGLRRPLFHATRIAGALAGCLRQSDATQWGLEVEGALPPDEVAAASRVAPIIRRLDERYLLLMHTGFLAALVIGAWRRSLSVMVLATAVLGKIVVHGVMVAVARYFLVVTALEAVCIGAALAELRGRRDLWLLGVAPLLGASCLWAGLQAGDHARDWARAREEDHRGYRFVLGDENLVRMLSCVVRSGRVTLYTDINGYVEATILFRAATAQDGETASVECRPEPTAPAPLALEVYDGFPEGGMPGRVEQRVSADGALLYRRDIAAEPGTGWSTVAVPSLPAGDPRTIRLDLAALHPDPDMHWGNVSSLKFRVRL